MCTWRLLYPRVAVPPTDGFTEWLEDMEIAAPTILCDEYNAVMSASLELCASIVQYCKEFFATDNDECRVYFGAYGSTTVPMLQNTSPRSLADSLASTEVRRMQDTMNTSSAKTICW